uniref:Enoyl reductase (ER) domain-containing protein n=1 Tax=Oryza punctata TaxID=4537 RepID=A0A0E0LH88_ORYPU
MAEVSNRKVVLRRYVTGYPTEDDFEVVAGTARLAVPPGMAAAAVLVKNLYLSCDAWMRGRMSGGVLTVANDFVLGEAMTNFGVAKVVDSTHPGFLAGDLVWGMSGWEEYTLVADDPAAAFVKINHPDLPLSYYTGVLGMSGLTAYAGLFEVCKPAKGDRVFVSAASGAVGQVVGQLAKLAGCYVVGSVGSDEKVSLLKTRFGFDDAINYKAEADIEAALRRRFPEGIDAYFDNVGGATLDAALACMRLRGRVAVCGMVSQYNLRPEEEDGGGVRMRNLACIVAKRVRMEGFNVVDYLADGAYYRRFEEEMAGHLRDGRVVYVEDVAEGLESAPAALVGIFRGRNVGRQLVVVARE